MKAYTDIEQSKVLAEFLPLESADMGLYYSRNPNAARNQMWVGTKTENADIPCWSLAALLNVLPKGTRLLKSATDDIYHCDCPKCNIDEWFNSSVDAAFKMIVWLKENKKI